MPYYCPKHPGTELEEVRSDVYYCPTCNYDWLIKVKNTREQGVLRCILNCPKHPETQMKKNYLDSYYCPTCGIDWLIHPFRSEKRGVRIKKKRRSKKHSAT